MIRLLTSYWWHNKSRFLLMLAGVILISGGLSVLSGLMESNKGTVLNTLQNKWHVSYHILVRPPGTSLTDEANRLMEPNLPGGISGGISLSQYEKIKGIPGIDVAAPLAVIGYTSFGVGLNEHPSPSTPGIYRDSSYMVTNNGVQRQTSQLYENYVMVNPWKQIDTIQTNELINLNQNPDYFRSPSIEFQELLVGIDPLEEQKLVGLADALEPLKSRYFPTAEQSRAQIIEQNVPYSKDKMKSKMIEFPVLVSKQVLPENVTYTFRLDRLKFPFENQESAALTMQRLKGKEAVDFLDRGEVESNSFTVTYTSKQVSDMLTADLLSRGKSYVGFRYFLKSTPLSFKRVPSPFKERWPNAYQLYTYNPLNAETNLYRRYNFLEYYRPVRFITDSNLPDQIANFSLFPNFIGIYDPEKLSISNDDGRHFPMDTYMTPGAMSVLDKSGRPVNPPTSLSSIHNPLGFLTSPPTMITTLRAAEFISGDKPISVIRVKVSGVSEVSDDSRAKLERVAEQIRKKTGLLTDITYASSPQSVVVRIPPSGTQTELGWIEQQWIKLGAAFSLVTEVKIGYSGLLILVLLVAMIYVFVTSLISFLARKEHFAILLSIGWRPFQVRLLLFVEATAVGLFSALITYSFQGVLAASGREILILDFLEMGGVSCLIFILGSAGPIFLAGRISPLSALKVGEISNRPHRVSRVNHIFQLSLAHFWAKRKRNILSVLSMAMPTTLLMTMIFITYHLKGIFYTTWLGQYAVLKIGPMHYVTVLICLVIAVLTVAELMWQNIAERDEEFRLLKALGWRKATLRKLIYWEGVYAGVSAGLLSLVLGLLLIFVMYRQLSASVLWTAVLAAGLPLLAGLAGCMFPAERAVRRGPYRRASESTRTSSFFNKAFAGILGVMLIVVMSYSLFSVWRATEFTINRDFKGGAPAGKGVEVKSHIVGDVTKFKPITVESGSKAEYEIDLAMSKDGHFYIEAGIDVRNISDNTWDELVFYMIPNMFTKKEHPNIYRKDADFTLRNVQVDGEKADFSLTEDRLEIRLQDKLPPNKETKVKISYSFSVPEQGIRFSRLDETYDLAQWYPMLAVFTDRWNKEPYSEIIESYYTDFSDFTVNYQLPEPYRIISSAEDSNVEAKSNGTLKVSQVKEFMLIISKDLVPISDTVGSIEVRVWTTAEDMKLREPVLRYAKEAVTFYNDSIGPYGSKELDVVLGERWSMEYPGVVTINKHSAELQHTVAHEIAHQWFYGIVNSDPYHDGWLDEGMTELATSLHLGNFSYSERYYVPGRYLSNSPISDLKTNEIASAYYAQPSIMFKQLFEQYNHNGIEFLHSYFDNYKYKLINTKEFIRFTSAYFGMKDRSFFNSWLK